MGFVVPPIEFHLGLQRWQHWTLQVDELHVVLYSLEKAVRLLPKSNPSIVGVTVASGLRLRASTRSFRGAWEALTKAIVPQGPLREVLEADAQKLKHIAANWGFSNEFLARFRKLHHEHFSGYMGEKRKAMVRSSSGAAGRWIR
jgi:hypothetical protein